MPFLVIWVHHEHVGNVDAVKESGSVFPGKKSCLCILLVLYVAQRKPKTARPIDKLAACDGC